MKSNRDEMVSFPASETEYHLIPGRTDIEENKSKLPSTGRIEQRLDRFRQYAHKLV